MASARRRRVPRHASRVTGMGLDPDCNREYDSWPLGKLREPTVSS